MDTSIVSVCRPIGITGIRKPEEPDPWRPSEVIQIAGPNSPVRVASPEISRRVSVKASETFPARVVSRTSQLTPRELVSPNLQYTSKFVRGQMRGTRATCSHRRGVLRSPLQAHSLGTARKCTNNRGPGGIALRPHH